MRVTNEQLKLFLADSNLIPPAPLDKIFIEAEQGKRELGPMLLEAGLIDESGLQKVYAYVLGIPFVDLTKETIPLDIYCRSFRSRSPGNTTSSHSNGRART